MYYNTYIVKGIVGDAFQAERPDPLLFSSEVWKAIAVRLRPQGSVRGAELLDIVI
jgi:hypothetical protein